MYIHLTQHAVQRALERFNWDKDKLMSISIKAVTEGVCLLDDEVLRPMWLRTSLYNNSIPYMIDGVVVVFVDNAVKTVYPITGAGCYGT